MRSTAAHAVLSAVDTAAAQRAPGVAAVLAGRDLAGVVAPLAPRLDARGLRADHLARRSRPSRVRFVGEPIAVVVADTAYAAADAGELVRVDYESLPVVADHRRRARRGRPRLHADA